MSVCRLSLSSSLELVIDAAIVEAQNEFAHAVGERRGYPSLVHTPHLQRK
jgi:hypothetical protein